MANIQIPITENGTVTLATAGKYCDRNIEVDVKTPDRYEEGKKAEYDAFWDAVQQNGKRTSYNYGFAGASWNDQTFKPKYDIKPSWATIDLFHASEITDLEAILKECGVVLDISDNYNVGSVFDSGKFTVIPEIVFRHSIGTTYRTFGGCTDLHTIRKLTFPEGITANFNADAFAGCTKLKNVEFAGVIAFNINMQDCPLSKESMTSLINTLSGTASGKTVTLNKTAKETAFTADEWASLIATKSNWTFSLV